MESKAKCPKCGSRDLFLNELWKDSSIQWEQRDGKLDRNDGSLTEGNPYKVEGKCQNCKHYWTLRGVLQIDDLEQSLE